MPEQHVRPPVRRLTDSDARHLLAAGLIRACHKQGPARVALAAGCDEKTIRRARDEETTLGLSSVMNALDCDPAIATELFAAKGFELTPIHAAPSDIVPIMGAALVRIGNARHPSGPGGVVETDAELIGMEGDIDALIEAARAVKERIMAAKLRRAA